jgi:hypothetical protein
VNEIGLRLLLFQLSYTRSVAGLEPATRSLVGNRNPPAHLTNEYRRGACCEERSRAFARSQGLNPPSQVVTWFVPITVSLSGPLTHR